MGREEVIVACCENVLRRDRYDVGTSRGDFFVFSSLL